MSILKNNTPKQVPRIVSEWNKWLSDYDAITEFLYERNYFIYPLLFTGDAEEQDLDYRVGRLTMYKEFVRGNNNIFSGDNYHNTNINYLEFLNTVRELYPFYINDSKYLDKYNAYTLDDVEVEVFPGRSVELELRNFYAVNGHIYSMYMLWTIAAESYRKAGNFKDKFLVDFIAKQNSKNMNFDYRFEKYYLKRAADRGIFSDDELDRIKSILYIVTGDKYFEGSEYVIEKKGWFTSTRASIKLDIVNIDLVANFYKYISVDMLMSPSYDANNIVITGLLCNRLVVNYNTPGFTLTYGGFKTLVDISMEEEKTLLSDVYYSLLDYESIKDDPEIAGLVREFRAPLQHVLTEYSPLTLKSLIDNDYFNIKRHLLDTIVDRYYDFFWQITSSLYSAQKLLGFSHNNLHSQNIVVQPFKDPVTYCIPKENIELKDEYGEDLFPEDDDGDAVFENTPEIGLFKITNFSQSSVMEFSQKSLTPYYIAEKNNYTQTMNDKENDILTIFVDVFDFNFYQCLQERIENGTASKKAIQLYEFFRDIGSCSLKRKNKLNYLLKSKLEKICRVMDITCGKRSSMSLFNESDCKNDISPENLLAHFKELIKKDYWIGDKYCFRLLGR